MNLLDELSKPAHLANLDRDFWVDPFPETAALFARSGFTCPISIPHFPARLLAFDLFSTRDNFEQIDAVAQEWSSSILGSVLSPSIIPLAEQMGVVASGFASSSNLTGFAGGSRDLLQTTPLLEERLMTPAEQASYGVFSNAADIKVRVTFLAFLYYLYRTCLLSAAEYAGSPLWNNASNGFPALLPSDPMSRDFLLREASQPLVKVRSIGFTALV